MRRNLILGLDDPRFEEFIDIPMGIGQRHEPVIRGKGTPVWILVAYHNKHNMTPEQISQLWNGYVTAQEVEAAIAYAQAYPELIDDRFSDSES
jgi:uncharacterized protein (DUF433 family)